MKEMKEMKKRYYKYNPICDMKGFESIYYTTSVSEKTIINDIIVEDKSGFTSDIQFAGCTGEVISQENHILSPKGGSGSVYPKNIVFQTDGSGNTFGSFFRDDTLTNPKGDIRGSGANDLSVSRDLCSQVASGAFSSILSGENNTASRQGTIVLGGNSNIADGSNCIVMGGLSNRSGGGFNNAIITGFQNQTIQQDLSSTLIDVSNSLIMTGTKNIMNGNNSVFITGRDISGQNITLTGRIPFSSCAIITGQSNTILPVTNAGPLINNGQSEFIFIGTGSNNKTSLPNSILTGSDINLGTYDITPAEGLNIIYTGRNISSIPLVGGGPTINVNSAYLCADEATNFRNLGSIPVNNNLGFLPGFSNMNILSDRQGSLYGGIRNEHGVIRTAIITGSNNFINNNTANGSDIICTGINNRSGSFGSGSVSFNFSTVITGSNHGISSVAQFGYISGMRNRSAVTGSLNNLFGGGSNNISSANNSSIICGTDNSSTNSANAVIASGISNVINGTFTNSFMTGIGGLLTTPLVTSAAVFGQSNLQGATGTPSSNRLFMIGNGTGTRRNAFSVTENGVVRAQRVFSTGGADFAEYFESYQGLEKLPLHESVCLIDDRFLGKKIENGFLVSSEDGFQEKDLGKIILASQVPDEIEAFGVITNNSSYIGNSYDEEWQGKYEKDDNGNFIYVEEDKIEYEDVFDISYNEIINYIEEKRISDNEEVYYQKIKQVKLEEIKIPIIEEISVYDEHGQLLRIINGPKKNKIITKVKTKKISESYNPSQIYFPRSQRPEWNLIGLRGQVIIKKGQRTIPKTTRIGEYNHIYDKYLI